MQPAVALLGLASIAATITVRHNARRFVVALVLSFVWATANFCWRANALIYLPIADLLIGLLVISLYEVRRSHWVQLAIWITAARLCAHLTYSQTGWYTAYAWTLNLTFAAHIINTGGWNGLDFGPVHDRLCDLLGLRRPDRAVRRAAVSQGLVRG